MAARRYELAIRDLREILAANPTNAEARASLRRCYLETGEREKALQELRAAVQAAPTNSSCLAGLGYACGVLGQRREALEQLRVLDALPAKQAAVPMARAAIHVGLGQTNEALTILEQAVTERDAYQQRGAELFGLKVDPTYDRLRGASRFQKLLRKMGLDK